MSVITHCDFCQTATGPAAADTPAMIIYGGWLTSHAGKYRRRARYDLCDACMHLALKALRAAARARKS